MSSPESRVTGRVSRRIVLVLGLVLVLITAALLLSTVTVLILPELTEELRACDPSCHCNM